MRIPQPAWATLNGFLNAVLVRAVDLLQPALAHRAAPSPVHMDNPFPARPRVLVVDDHLEHRLMLAALLHRWAIRPVQAADGAEAVCSLAVSTST